VKAWLFVASFASLALGSLDAQATPRSRARLCEGTLTQYVTPARAEWAYWVAWGARAGGERSPAARADPFALGLGAELVWRALVYRGFPSVGGPNNGRSELRWGPWVAAANRAGGGLVESGLKLHWGGVYTPAWGAWDVRLGGGYGAFGAGAAPHVTMSLLWGVRNPVGRYRDRSSCVGPPAPLAITEASLLRAFATYRRPLTPGNDDGHELFLGVELSPTFLWFR
jgi:hypothetical protein